MCVCVYLIPFNIYAKKLVFPILLVVFCFHEITFSLSLQVKDKARSAKAVEFVTVTLHPTNQLFGHPGVFIHNTLSHIGICNATLILKGDSDYCVLLGLAFLYTLCFSFPPLVLIYIYFLSGSFTKLFRGNFITFLMVEG